MRRRKQDRRDVRLPARKPKQNCRRMRIRIEKLYGYYYHSGFDKFVVMARIYVNGRCQHRNLFFYTEEEVKNLKEGSWIEY